MAEAINSATNTIGITVSSIINSAVKIATKQELLTLNIYRANIKTEAEAQKAIAELQRKLDANSGQEAQRVPQAAEIEDTAEISQSAKNALAAESAEKIEV